MITGLAGREPAPARPRMPPIRRAPWRDAASGWPPGTPSGGRPEPLSERPPQLRSARTAHSPDLAAEDHSFIPNGPWFQLPCRLLAIAGRPRSRRLMTRNPASSCRSRAWHRGSPPRGAREPPGEDRRAAGAGQGHCPHPDRGGLSRLLVAPGSAQSIATASPAPRDTWAAGPSLLMIADWGFAAFDGGP